MLGNRQEEGLDLACACLVGLAASKQVAEWSMWRPQPWIFKSCVPPRLAENLLERDGLCERRWTAECPDGT